MREIKFKIWDKDCKKFITNTDYKEFVINMQGQAYIINGYFDNAKVDEYSGVEILQYTGLKDRKGREIYEGDIIKILIPVRNRVVEFGNGRFYFKDTSRFGDFEQHLSKWLIDDYKIEVIGNIYENSELLK